MYFVTMGGMSGYVSFTTTPSGRAAIGLTDTGKVRLLSPGASSTDWTIVREIVKAMWSIEAGGPEARDRVSRALALVKAVDD